MPRTIETFPNRIVALRRKVGFTQQDLADALGLERTTITKWENGETTPSISRLDAISEALNTTVEALITEENVLENELCNQRELKRLMLIKDADGEEVASICFHSDPGEYDAFISQGYSITLFVEEE